MYELKIDKTRNKLTIIFKGIVDKRQAEAFYIELQQIIHQLKKGFKILTDLSLLEEMDIAAHESIAEAMDTCNQNGVSKVIRVIPKQVKDIGFNIMSLFHYSKDVIVHTYDSLEEAQQHLL